jgi:hypothetical protein
MWLPQADVIRRVQGFYHTNKPKEKAPVRNTVKGWLEAGIGPGIVEREGEGRNVMWRLI